jgi:hypothetical protein
MTITGCKVEVTGTVAKRPAAAIGTSGSTGQAASGTPSAAIPQPLQVETVKTISSTCSR